ncbi:Protein-associating with the carboxyl-terminal domain of ezrin [Schistosoma japonicum]|uniref:Protein-associating with the carboxyl-terminal domain of ezrin n=1 Tax=Schistosoma japonicum TaxID=6182 RepID=A0A4Z2DKJ0_SCHJA|nr:Protein-associating with the carboxyl-terminal domain of ezrin [Schistosoma japonicum]
MGNNFSDPSIHLIKSECLRGGFAIYKNNDYEVSFHHTFQPVYNKFRIIKYLKTPTAPNRNSDSQSDMMRTTYMDLTTSNFLLSASIPAKLRHPSILRVHKAFPDASDSLYLVVENSVPFSAFISKPTMDDLLAGSHSLLSALHFLHNTLGVSHNNIDTTSVFIDSQRCWKLCGFEFALEFSDMSADHVARFEALKGRQDTEALNFDPSYPFCYDIYCFSRMVCALTEVGVEGHFYQFAQVLAKSCMHSVPKVRIPSNHLLAHPSFKSPYIFALDFLDTYMTRTDAEKEVFFRSFAEKILNSISEELFCSNILPRMFESTIFLDYPSQTILGQIFHSCEGNLQESPKHSWIISLKNFQKFISPLIVQKFMVNERHTRILLLQHFTGYLKALTDSDLLNVILPQVSRGVFDNHNTLSVLSLQALGYLANRLNATVVLNRLRCIEQDLCKSGKLKNSSNNSNTNSFNNSLITCVWPRGNLFYEAAPKIGRNNREIPNCEKKMHSVNESNPPLAKLAVFSPDYDPSMNCCLLSNKDNLSTDSRLSDGGDILRLSSTPNATVTTVVSNTTSITTISSLDGVAERFKESPCYFENNTNCLNNSLEIYNKEREVDALLNLMEPVIVQKPVPLSPLNYAPVAYEVEVTGPNEFLSKQSTDEPPKKKKSSGSRSKSPRKLTGTSRKSNNQLTLNNDLIDCVDQLDDATIKSFGCDYYLFIIRQLEMQVNAYENYIEELSLQSEEIMTKFYSSDSECQDHFRTLNKIYQERINEAADLTERIQATKCVYSTNLEKWRARENELQILKKSTEERMTAENLAIANELASLEEFRLNREALWIHYHNLECTLERLRNEHKLAIENLLERDLAYRGRLKKVTKLKINEVASEFRSVSLQRTEPTIKRMLAENVSIEDQLVKLSVAIADMSRENANLLTEFHNLTEKQSNLEKEQILLSTRNSAITKISHLLSIFQGKLDQKIEEAEEKNEISTNLSIKCNRLEQEKQILSKKFEDLTNKRNNLANNLNNINKVSTDCTDSIHHLTDCIAYAAGYIQTILSSNSDQLSNETCQTTNDELNIEDTKEILFKLYSKLNSVDCLMNKYDPIQMDYIDDENKKEINNDENITKYDDNLSDISEPNYNLDIDDTMLISEPEDNDHQQSSNNLEDKLMTSRKLDDSNRIENMERLDKIWSQINTSYLQSYNPASNEWKEILNVLAKNQINWSEKLKNKSDSLFGGYLKPGDLKFIPPPSAKLLTKKEYMRLLRRKESKSRSRSGKSTGSISDDINERSRSIGVQTRSSSCVRQLKIKQLRFEE